VVYGRLSPAGKRMATPWAQPHLANEAEREKNDKERSEWGVEQDVTPAREKKRTTRGPKAGAQRATIRRQLRRPLWLS
jgi:hypothetical protein